MDKREHLVLSIIAGIAILTGLLNTGNGIKSFLIQNTLEAGRLAAVMGWETWWALVLGFTIAGGVEAWIPKEKIVSYMEGSSPKEIGIASFFGFVSSSCSFSAIATAKNLFKKGASAATSLGAFMFASTNLVIEIGLVMWVLLGWQFVLADFIGGLILITLLSVIFSLIIPENIIKKARQHAINKEGLKAQDPVCGMDVDIQECENKIENQGKTYYFCSENCKESFKPEEDQRKSIRQHLFSKESWKQLAKVQWKEWKMLYEDIIVGFILAGIIGAFVPTSVWTSLFGSAANSIPIITYTTALGAIIGVITFVCSVGNVPFAAILWNNGLPFGSVLSYIYADLIVPPIMDAYRKYYGKGFAVILSTAIFLTAVSTGVIIHYLFSLSSLIPQVSSSIAEKSIELNYKALLNLVFLGVFVTLYRLK